MHLRDHFDSGSLTIIVITLVLFVVALFTKGFTHDLLLEAGVFVVSVKLIMMAYGNSVSGKDLRKRLDRIEKILQEMKSKNTGSD